MASVQAPDISLDLVDLRSRPYELSPSMLINAEKVVRDNLKCVDNRLTANQRQQLAQQEKCMAAQLISANAAAHQNKRKNSSKPQAEKLPRIQPVQQMTPFFNGAQSPAARVGLSLGQVSACDLRSRLEDAGSTVTSSNQNPGLLMTLNDFLSAQITKQHDEILDFLKMQIDELRRSIEERVQFHAKTFLASLEERISHILHFRDVELKQMIEKNLELQQKVNHLSLETQAWQSKAWTYDTMVTALRANLQQVLTHQTKCQDKVEGFGDSDNDASSVYVDEAALKLMSAAPAMANQASWHRACKECKSNEACILLVPCLHLCLCKECCNNIERCPSCNFPISDRVEVFLS